MIDHLSKSLSDAIIDKVFLLANKRIIIITIIIIIVYSTFLQHKLNYKAGH